MRLQRDQAERAADRLARMSQSAAAERGDQLAERGIAEIRHPSGHHRAHRRPELLATAERLRLVGLRRSRGGGRRGGFERSSLASFERPRRASTGPTVPGASGTASSLPAPD